MRHDATGKTAIAGALSDNVRIMMEFYKTEANISSGYAKAQIYVPGTALDTNRYYVASSMISQNTDPSNPTNLTTLPYVRFYTSTDFSQ